MKHRILSLIAMLIAVGTQAQTINVHTPSGGQFVRIGQSSSAQATFTGTINKFKVELYNFNSAIWYTLADSLPTPSLQYVMPPMTAPSQVKIRISDAYNASVFDESNNFNVSPLTPLSTQTQDFQDCNDMSMPIGVQASGGTEPYKYKWSDNGTGTMFTSDTIQNPHVYPFVATYYNVTVTDANGLTITDSVLVDHNYRAPQLTFDIAPAICSGVPTGSITVHGTNECSPQPISYTWNTSQTNDSILSNLEGGLYYVTVQSCNGCHTDTSILVPTTITLQASSNNIVNASACNASDGSACITPTGGTAPYTFAWSNGQSTSCISGVSAGIYTTTVTDPNGCSTVIGVDIEAVNSHILVLPDSIRNVQCNGNASGAIYVSVGGGTLPYTYNWSNGTTNEDVTNLNPGSYVLSVTDNVGCFHVDTFVVNEPTLLLVDSIATTNITCYGIGDGNACVYVSGGTAPYTFQWQPSITNTGCGTNLTAGNYPVVVTDAAGCTTDTVVTIYSPPPFTVSITNTGDGVMPDTLTTTVTGGIPPYNYNWLLGEIMPEIAISISGEYRLTVTDANGCSANDSLLVGCPDTCVWPGDADYSGVADNNDLLAIGIGYGTIGTPRSNQSIVWGTHQSTNWVDYLGDTTNYKHIDCNGDGIINSDDTLAIIQNYYLQHPRSGGPDEPRGGIPTLRIRMVPDTLEDGQTVIAHLELGDVNSTADNVYGLAFTFNFDPLVVDTNEVYIAFNNNSWLCNTSADHIDISKKDASSGKLYTALTRIDHATRSGGGEIGNVSMKITTGNINGKDLAFYAMNTYITDLRVIDNQGNVLDVDVIGDASTVQYEPTGINEINWVGEVSLYPNPAQQQLNISSSRLPISSLQVSNLLGGTVLEQQGLNTSKSVLNIATLSDGVYILKIASGSSTYHTKFMVSK